MRTIPKWVNKIHEADKIESSSVYTLCYNPEGTQLVVGAGEKVMVYDPQDGELVQLLQAHKGAVHAVAYCGDGNKFASGSADKTVIIWTSKLEGFLKYSHSESIQCLAYNPVSLQLASCALSDFAFWSADVKAVQKYRVAGHITCCAWSPNGQFLAIGLAIGAVSLRSKIGEEIQIIQRNASVWAVAFTDSTLLVSDWNETLSFYNTEGQQVLKDQDIGLAGLSITIYDELVLVGGVGGWCILTTEGNTILNTPQEWVWAITSSSSQNTLAVACQDGTLWCYQIVFNTVHGLYRDRYAYRENITELIICQLTSGNKVRIKCHDLVQKIAIYKHRLAVHLPDRVLVYVQDDADGMLYRVKEKITQKSECSLLITTSDSLLFCQDNTLTTMKKPTPRFWSFPATIRYVKVTTLYFVEVVLLGLLNGQIWQVEPKEGDPKLFASTPSCVRCLDVSASRNRLAVVDDSSICRVYCLRTAEMLYFEEDVSSVAWNSLCNELLCLSGGGFLSIKAGNFPAATQPHAGSVVGFQGGRVFCLQGNTMQSMFVPLSHAVHQYVQRKMFNDAYAVACLGVTALDWERLGMAAIDELAFEVARKAFQRSENITYLTLIDQLQERFEAGEKRGVILGEVLAYRGKYTDAANSFQTAGRDDRALNLYLDLRMFSNAQELVREGEGVAALARRRAEWARHVSEPRAAAEMYLAVGDVRRAAQLMADNGRRDMLIELARKLDKGSSESLRHVAEALMGIDETGAAAIVYQRLGDYKKVAQIAVSTGEWSRAFALALEHSECKSDVYMPYAHRMLQENKYTEAQKAYHMAGETATAKRVFGVLVGNAVAEERFADAGYLHYILAAQCLQTANSSTGKDRESALHNYEQNAHHSSIYHAYDIAHRCVHEPFSLSQPDALLNAARYALAHIGEKPPAGVSAFCLYLCIAKQAKILKANTLAQQMLDKILNLQIPPKFQESVELLLLKSQAKASSGDNQEEEVAPLCWRCRKLTSPLCATHCPHCNHQLMHSFVTYEVLPLVRFEPAEGITFEETLDLIERTPLPEATTKGDAGDADILRVDHDIDSSDPFLDKIDEDNETGVVVCTRNALLSLNPGTVVTVLRPPLPPRFYRNMLPELQVAACTHCQSLFYMEDYEIQLVMKGYCPFCQYPAEESATEDALEGSLVNGSITHTPDSLSNGHSSW